MGKADSNSKFQMPLPVEKAYRNNLIGVTPMLTRDAEWECSGFISKAGNAQPVLVFRLIGPFPTRTAAYSQGLRRARRSVDSWFKKSGSQGADRP